jgi:xanthine/CO dehydrogenase XdhC/CoxF family maturation factor
MKEIRDIINAYKKAQEAGEQVALATVVQVEGSSYRQPGARMLITERGELTGAISGGCLEGDALRKALKVINEKRKMLVTYDTSDEDDAKLGMGLGCNGIIQVLIEPVNPSDNFNPIHLLQHIAEGRANTVLVTLFSLNDRKAHHPGTCLLIMENGTSIGPSSWLQDSIIESGKTALRTQTSVFQMLSTDAGTFNAFIEVIKPAISLVIFGAGADVLPLVNMGQLIGWECTVIDGRPNYANKDRFPAGVKVILSKAESALQYIDIDGQTVFALMTHNYNYDLEVLKQLLLRPTKYIGLLGPKKKRERLLNEIKESGMLITEQMLQSLYGPVGLDIGAETPEEIALSIVSEIKAVLSGKVAGSLRDNRDTIHPR